MLQPFEAMLQQCCNAVLRLKPLLRIVPCNITFKENRDFKIQRRDGNENVA